MRLSEYGWNKFFEQEWQAYAGAGFVPGRIIADYGKKLRVVIEEGEVMAEWAAKKDTDDKPAVGDWVALDSTSLADTPLIKGVLARRTKFSRAAAGREVKEQVVAANVDIVFLVQSLNRDFNLRRMERYLIATWESGAVPVIVLTKADCCDEAAKKSSQIQDLAPGVDVHVVSALTGLGMAGLNRYIAPGKTLAFLGSSGVGKSTLINTLAGAELLVTQEIREHDSRGRHTTAHREIILLPGGGLVMDTPGMRALMLWEADTGMSEMFGEIQDLIASCRFADCSHGNEPGCAIREALESGGLERKRWESWQKLQKELAYIEAKREGKVRLNEKLWGKEIAKKIKKEVIINEKK